MKVILALTLVAAATPAFAQQTAPTDPPGGYQPASPPPRIAPGQPFVYVQAPPPDVAYPAPAPLASYPVCKHGQYDKCIEPGAK